MTSFLSCLSLSIIISAVIYLETISANRLLPSVPECGVFLTNRHAGGIEAELDSYPWMALLEYSKPNGANGIHCAGVLISKRYVLTAAHCVNGKGLPSTWNLINVRLGEHDLLKEKDCTRDGHSFQCNPPVIDMPISEKIVHELYDPQSKNAPNDIALLRLKSDVVYTDFVKPICLPHDSKLRGFNYYDNVKLDAAGWHIQTNEYSVKLTGQVTGINNAECKQVYGKLGGISLQDSQLCAKAEHDGFDPCNALYASPITRFDSIDRKPFSYLVGLKSFGPSSCGKDAVPDVFTRIDSYVGWIESKVYA